MLQIKLLVCLFYCLYCDRNLSFFLFVLPGVRGRRAPRSVTRAEGAWRLSRPVGPAARAWGGVAGQMRPQAGTGATRSAASMARTHHLRRAVAGCQTGRMTARPCSRSVPPLMGRLRPVRGRSRSRHTKSPSRILEVLYSLLPSIILQGVEIPGKRSSQLVGCSTSAKETPSYMSATESSVASSGSISTSLLPRIVVAHCSPSCRVWTVSLIFDCSAMT